MQQNGAAVASHYLIMMQALRNGVIGRRGRHQMRPIKRYADTHADILNEEVASTRPEALEEAEDMEEADYRTNLQRRHCLSLRRTIAGI